MTEKAMIRAWLLFLFVFCLTAISSPVFAQAVVVPTINSTFGYPGYNPSAGTLRSFEASFNAASANYNQPASVRAGGVSIPVPAKLALGPTAAAVAKAGMRANPYLMAGTLGLHFLSSNGISLDSAGAWQKFTPSSSLSDYSYYPVCTSLGYLITSYQGCFDMGLDPSDQKRDLCLGLFHQGVQWQYLTSNRGNINNPKSAVCIAPLSFVMSSDSRPVTDSDWDSLPSPFPTIGPEAAQAPYLPTGVPVGKPFYDFVPFNAPTGVPYKTPEGSTVQPGVTISPNGNSVTIVNNTTTIINNAGDVVNNPQPVTAPASHPEQVDPCDKNPDRAGCVELGSVENVEMVRTVENIDFSPESVSMPGSCPSGIALPGGNVLSFDFACSAMGMIRSVVIALASLMGLLIIYGGIRS